MVSTAGNSHLENAYTSSTWEKIVGNDQEFLPGTFLTLVGGYLMKAGPSDEIEGVCISAVKTGPTNTTTLDEKLTALYKPVRHDHTLKIQVVNGSLMQSDVGLTFNIDTSSEQFIEYSTAGVGNQFRLESIFDEGKGERGEFTILRTMNVLSSPQGPVGPVGPVGPLGLTGGLGPRGYKGDKGDQGPEGCEGPTGPVGPEGPVGPIGLTGNNGLDGASFTWKGGWNSGATYDVNDVVFYNGSSWINTCPGSINQEPGVDACWDLHTQAGTVGATGPMGPTGPAGGPAGPAGSTGPAGPAGPSGPAGPTGPTGTAGIPGIQGIPGPMTDEFATARCSVQTELDVPQLTSEHMIVPFHQFYGNGAMKDSGTTFFGLRASSTGVYEIDGTLSCLGAPNQSGDAGLTIARMVLLKTDNVGNIDMSRFGFVDVKDGEAFSHNDYRFFMLKGNARIPLTTGDRVVMLMRGSCDTILPGTLIIEGPSGVPGFSGGAGPFGRAILSMHKIYNAI